MQDLQLLVKILYASSRYFSRPQFLNTINTNHCTIILFSDRLTQLMQQSCRPPPRENSNFIYIPCLTLDACTWYIVEEPHSRGQRAKCLQTSASESELYHIAKVVPLTLSKLSPASIMLVTPDPHYIPKLKKPCRPPP